jgi:hypothetical protein
MGTAFRSLPRKRGRDAVARRFKFEVYLFLNFGGRFSMKAAMPSF